jgi:hypothetical protein
VGIDARARLCRGLSAALSRARVARHLSRASFRARLVHARHALRVSRSLARVFRIPATRRTLRPSLATTTAA